MADLKTDYKDDVLDTSQNINRTFTIKDSSGNILYQDCQIEETTVFETEGDEMNAQVINNTNTEVNNLNDNLTADDDLKFRFATDGEGNHGYLGADDSFIPFNTCKIKNVTRGSFTFASNIGSSQIHTYRDITIAPVDMSKTVVFAEAVVTSSVNADGGSYEPRAVAVLTSSTNLRIYYSSYGKFNARVDYQIVTFESGISVQRGSLVSKTGVSSQTINFNSINTATSILFTACSFTSGTNYDNSDISPSCSGTITSSTSATIYWGAYQYTAKPIIIGWQLITFV